MRIAFAAAWLVVGFPLWVSAQQQERGLMDRLLRPDMELGSGMQDKEFSGGGGFAAGGSVDGSRTFGGTRDASTGEFSGMRSFLGIKNPWFGSKVFDAGEAPLFSSGMADTLLRGYDTRQAGTKAYRDAGREAAVDGDGVAVREFVVRGAAQGSLDSITGRIHQEMTIDEVRELLNKPR
jgi:hypothetical protein